MKSLLLQSSHYDIIIERPELEKLRACMVFGSHMVTLHIEERVVQLTLEYTTMKYTVAKKSDLDSMNTENDDFTSAISVKERGSKESTLSA